MPPLLEACDVSRRSAEGTRLLDEVSLRLDAGDRCAIVGPTGSGKTLLLRALACLDPLDAGEIRWRGEPVADRDVPRFRSQVTYIQQRPALIEGSVCDNLRLPFTLKTHRGRRFSRDWHAAQLLAVDRDAKFLDRDANNLSGGERQIVALLRALQLDPTVLLLDEPTAALDADAAHRMEQLILRWADESGERSTLWVTHDAAQAQRVGDRRLRMNRGRLSTGVHHECQ